MISAIFRVLVLLLIPLTVMAQNLQLSVNPATSGYGVSTFQLDDGAVSFSSATITFAGRESSVSGFDAVGISSDLSLLGFLNSGEEGGRAALVNTQGDTLIAFSTVSLSAGDPSLAFYPLNSGHVFIRDNITNFTFYDTFGELETSMSSSSQSEEGELISEVAMSRDGSTLVIYNPKIRRQGKIGSQARVNNAELDFETVYFSTDRYLKDVTVSEDGTMIIAITAVEEGDDEIIIMDRHGNRLNSLTTGEDVKGAGISDDGNFLTLFSGGRIQVFGALTGERIGSISVRQPLFRASYFPEDGIVLAISGNYSASTGDLNSIQFHAVDLNRRSIARQPLKSSLRFNEFIEPRLIRLAANRYRLTGANRHIDISASF